MKKAKLAASINIQRPGMMSGRGAKSIALWIRRMADALEKNHGEMTNRTLRCRYYY
ncbi:MAG: hypothetical protein ABFD89_03665 [Bryobacteraceae bacterium]